MSVVIPVILCGGSGTRLWPLSRSDRPKQFISLFGDYTLLEGTLLRAKTIAGAGDPICVTAAAYGSEVRQSLDRLGLRGRLLLEPEPRNTAPALCAAALVAMRTDPKAVIVALPADHVIEDGEAFAASIANAVAAAEKNWLAILGVRPRHASSALGYIVPGAALAGLPQINRVSRFLEKPEPEIAAGLVSTGALWNAGIVVARADAVIPALRKHEPAVLDAVERSLANGRSETADIGLNQADFAAAPRISFDKAVLERHEAVAVTALDAMWRDVGTWTEVAELYPPDGDGNRKTGRVNFVSSRDMFVFGTNRLTVGIGVKDLIIIDTQDVLLIANRGDLERIRDVVDGMASANYPEVAAAADRTRLGGGLAPTEGAEVTLMPQLLLGPGETRSCEPHPGVSRFGIVLLGSVTVTIGSEALIYGVNESFCIPPDTAHIIANEGLGPVSVVVLDVTGNA